MKNLLFFLAIALLISCGSDDETVQTPAPVPDDEVVKVLTKIEITSSNGTRLDLDETTTLTASGFDQLNETFDITATLTWSANNSNVSIDQTSLQGLTVGKSIITAASGDVSANFTISVWDSSAPRTDIYVSDAGNLGSPPFKIFRFDENGENAEVFISQNLAWPQDILFLEDQEVVLISNLNSGNINRHNANTGEFIDSFATGISGPTRIKIGSDNLLYVLQWSGNGIVLRYQLDGTFVDQFTDVGVTQSIGLDWDSSGNLYVSSFNNGSGGFVRKFDPSGNDLGIFINNSLQGPTNIWFDDTGNLAVNDWQAGTVKSFDSNGTLLNTLIQGLSQPEGIAFLSNGNFLIGNGGTGAVKMYDSNNNFIEDLVSRGSGGLLTPNAVVLRKVN